jgi:hypothetical protein
MEKRNGKKEKREARDEEALEAGKKEERGEAGVSEDSRLLYEKVYSSPKHVNVAQKYTKKTRHEQ